ncbi:MAG: gliding motility-associated C-terminal domain-containing protein [Bacteroidales bacterium]|nr:gliding motility-associated C-terminal domain-containing protein [Bacteroidales bacterium]
MKLDLIKNIALILLWLNPILFEIYCQDEERPESPTLERISVDPFSGHTLLQWTLSSSPDVEAYIIYIDKNNNWIAIDTIWDSEVTLYENTSSNASVFSESYVIAARDSADNISPLTDPHSTIFCNAEFDSCQAQVIIYWSPYIGWNDSIDSYIIYQSIEEDSFKILQQISPSDNQFIQSDIQAHTEYCYYVEAIHTDGIKKSTSNMTCEYTQMTRAPEYINADYATVSGENEISLSFTVDPASEIKNFKLLRSNDKTGPFDTIADFQKIISNKIEYIDQELDLNQNHYYWLAAMNVCNKMVQQSNLSGNIVLTVSNQDRLNTLSWTPYQYWHGGIDEYQVSRLPGNGMTALNITLSGSDSTWSDNIGEFLYTVTDRKFCYFVEAIEGDTNPYGIKARSKSNTSCVILSPNVFMPNAFTPNGDGKNDFIKPILSFMPKDYVFIIRNRWGNKIFETKDHLATWDGKVRNKFVQEGVYIYFLRIITHDGETIEKNGHITVIYSR